MMGQFCCSSETLNPWEHGSSSSSKRGGAESDTAGFHPGVSCCLREDERRLAWKTHVFPVVSRRKQGTAHDFLDFRLPEQINAYLCVSTQRQKSDCLKMYFHIYTHGAQKSRHSGYVSTKIGNAHCILMKNHEKTKLERERDFVSNSHQFHHRARKRACVKKVNFGCFLKTEIRSCCSRPSSPEPMFLPETLDISRSNAQETTRSGKTGTCQNHMTNCEKTTKFNATKKYKKYSLTYKTYSAKLIHGKNLWLRLRRP